MFWLIVVASVSVCLVLAYLFNFDTCYILFIFVSFCFIPCYCCVFMFLIDLRCAVLFFLLCLVLLCFIVVSFRFIPCYCCVLMFLFVLRCAVLFCLLCLA